MTKLSNSFTSRWVAGELLRRDQGRCSLADENQSRILIDKFLLANYQDLVCLGQLLGSIEPVTTDHCDRFDFDTLAKTLRQSIALLKTLNLAKYAACSHKHDGYWWLDRKDISRTSGIGFPKYVIDLKELRRKIGTSVDSVTPPSLVDRLTRLEIPGNRNSSGATLFNQLRSKWFIEFVEDTLARAYPLDKFTILMAICIISVECNHKTLEQLLGELIDQIFHQETNSCNSEELMQLTQVGSIWLSHRKRYLVTSRQQTSASVSEQNSDDEDELQTSCSSSSSLSSSSAAAPPPPESLSSNGSPAAKTSQRECPSGRLMDLRAELRKLIDHELLFGVECRLCGREPSGNLLEPIKLAACPGCSLASPPAASLAAHCSISHEPVELIALESLVRVLPASLEQLLVVTPNEWARQLLSVASQLGAFPARARRQKTGTRAERLDISENFERLTVLRAQRQDGATSGAGSDETSDDSDARSSTSGGDQGAPAGATTDDQCARLLGPFMRHRLKAQAAAGQLRAGASESVKLIKWLGAGAAGSRGPAGRLLAVCSSDLLVADSLDNLVRLQLVAGSAGSLAPPAGAARWQPSTSGAGKGPLWGASAQPILACRMRSPTSQLMLGCGRLFRPLELERRAAERAGPAPVCPRCGEQAACRLVALRALPDEPTAH